MRNLTKSQKIMILITIFWELFAYNINYNSRRGRLNFSEFVIISIPVIMYWSIVWIWGFNAFNSAFHHVCNYIKLGFSRRVNSPKNEKNTFEFEKFMDTEKEKIVDEMLKACDVNLDLLHQLKTDNPEKYQRFVNRILREGLTRTRKKINDDILKYQSKTNNAKEVIK